MTLHRRVERATRNPRSRSEERFSSQPGPVDQPDRTNPHTESYVAVGEIRWRPQARWVVEGFAEARSAPTGADQRGNSVKAEGQEAGAQPACR